MDIKTYSDSIINNLLFAFLRDKDIDIEALRIILEQRFKKMMTFPHFNAVVSAIDTLAVEGSVECEYSKDKVVIDRRDQKNRDLNNVLDLLKPWRKGPFHFSGYDIDSEWRSDLKWSRIKPHLEVMKHHKILDIGCNSGYYLFRMLAENPKLVVGIDPSVLCYLQFNLLNRVAKQEPLHFLPIGIEDMHTFNVSFNIVFSMGILYHARSPLDNLRMTRDCLVSEGTLFLETLIYPGDEAIAFCPEKTYAKMRNVYFLPTQSCLIQWLHTTGFKDIEVLSVTHTTLEEQRVTSWSSSQSLNHFLDSENPSKTVEGYPAPCRILLNAKRKKIGR